MSGTHIISNPKELKAFLAKKYRPWDHNQELEQVCKKCTNIEYRVLELEDNSEKRYETNTVANLKRKRTVITIRISTRIKLTAMDQSINIVDDIISDVVCFVVS